MIVTVPYVGGDVSAAGAITMAMTPSRQGKGEDTNRNMVLGLGSSSSGGGSRGIANTLVQRN